MNKEFLWIVCFWQTFTLPFAPTLIILIYDCNCIFTFPLLHIYQLLPGLRFLAGRLVVNCRKMANERQSMIQGFTWNSKNLVMRSLNFQIRAALHVCVVFHLPGDSVINFFVRFKWLVWMTSTNSTQSVLYYTTEMVALKIQLIFRALILTCSATRFTWQKSDSESTILLINKFSFLHTPISFGNDKRLLCKI